MYSSHLFLDSIPDVWKTYFKDKDFIKSLYTFIGTELSDIYADVLTNPASLGLDYIPLKRYKKWDLIQLDFNSRVAIPDKDGQDGLVLYGIVVREGYVETVSYTHLTLPTKRIV